MRTQGLDEHSLVFKVILYKAIILGLITDPDVKFLS